MAEKKYIDAAAILPLIPHIDGDTTIQCVERAIDHCPAADVAEVRHGHWCIIEYEYFTCSECGGSYNNGAYSTKEARELLANGEYYPHCPFCGAKMDGGKEATP